MAVNEFRLPTVRVVKDPTTESTPFVRVPTDEVLLYLDFFLPVEMEFGWLRKPSDQAASLKMFLSVSVIVIF